MDFLEVEIAVILQIKSYAAFISSFGAPYLACLVVRSLLPNMIGRNFLFSGGPRHWWRIPDIATPLAPVSSTNSLSTSGCAKPVTSISATLTLLKACCCSIPHENVALTPVIACKVATSFACRGMKSR